MQQNNTKAKSHTGIKQDATNNRFNLQEAQANKLAAFQTALEKAPFWQVINPKGQVKPATEPANSIGLLVSQTLTLYYPPVTALEAFLKEHPFSYLRSKNTKDNLATLDNSSQLLWNHDTSDEDYSLEDAKKLVAEDNWVGLTAWQLPSLEQLKAFAMQSHNPHRKGHKYYLARFSGKESWGWQTSQGWCWVHEDQWSINAYESACIFACHALWQKSSPAQILVDLIEKNWQLVSPSGKVFPEQNQIQTHNSPEALLTRLIAQGEELLSLPIKPSIKTPNNEKKGQPASHTLKPKHYYLNQQLKNLDYTPCRLPRLETAQLNDPEKGLWELWGQEAASLKKLNLVARDPNKDLKNRAVAIDFGTSSTVVAMDTASGARELLRIGVRDFYQAVEAKHFENPTVLECLDFAAFKKVWSSQAYRPELNWDWMRAAHEAQASFRDNPGDTAILACMIPRLKQWALRSTEDHLLRITGRQGIEIEIPHHLERNPVRGQPIEVAETDIFDPIELYAWYLGMAINWRGRGLFLKYYLSFPVKYPLEVKNRILASFRRGLQRSLPTTLIEHYPHTLNEFEVNDLASEPAAYAAAALPHLKVEPTDAGVPYAVFDFGGGTTDFDFGIFRWATDEEDAKGYERVFEHLASSGDNYLGGENLLEHLVYESFKANLDTLRKERIQFTRPIDAQAFPGSEAFIAATQAAQTNAVILSAKLRPFMEQEKPNLETQLKLELINTLGKKTPCELSLDAKMLDELLANRINRGMQAFLAEAAKIKPKLPDAPLHILLAGNGSRSRHLQSLCKPESEAWKALCQQAFGEQPPEIIIHQPLPMDANQPHTPTAKTGVALGLLQVTPGENTLLMNRVHERHDGQAPFAWFLGRLRRGKLEAILSPDSAYNEWQELGNLQEGVFNLYATTSPRALTGMLAGDTEIQKHRLDFPSATSEDKLFARIKSPNSIELATAANSTEVESVEKFRELDFKL